MEIYSVDLISKLLLLTPIWWLIGLKFFILHLVSIILFFKMIIISKRNRIKIRINITHKLLLYFILVYVVSITLNIPFNEKSRIIASLYNLSFWIMGFFLMITIYNDNTITIDKITNLVKNIKNIGIFHICIFLISILSFKQGNTFLALDTIVKKILPHSLATGLLDLSTTMHLYRSDWMFNVRMLRFTGTFNYPAELALGMIFILVMSYFYYKTKKVDIKLKAIITMIFIFIMFIMGLSRITWIGLAISVFMSSILFKKNICKRSSLKKSMSIIVIILLYAIITLNIPIVEIMYKSRENSNNARNLVYERAIEIGIENPVFGVGVKYDDPSILVPIGSHSTYIGTFMKTGFIGIILLISFIISMLIIWVKVRRNIMYNRTLYLLWQCCGIFLISSIIWMMTEDLDAPQIVAFYFFINCGLIIKLKDINEITK